MSLTAWSDRAPPREHWVAASYSVLEHVQIVKTCRRGCCVIHPIFGSLLLPRYWRDATEAEIVEAEAYLAGPKAAPTQPAPETPPEHSKGESK